MYKYANSVCLKRNKISNILNLFTRKTITKYVLILKNEIFMNTNM